MSRYHIPRVAVGVLYNGRADSDPLKQGVCRCIAECIREQICANRKTARSGLPKIPSRFNKKTPS